LDFGFWILDFGLLAGQDCLDSFGAISVHGGDRRVEIEAQCLQVRQHLDLQRQHLVDHVFARSRQ
jgi:hypothetical protein